MLDCYPVREDFSSVYAGADWIVADLKKPVSPLGRKVADILGLVMRGIYHLDHGAIRRTDWSNPHWIEVPFRRDLASYDNNQLTELLILCHEGAIRLDISPRTFQHLTLLFHQRARTGGFADRHPAIEQAVQAVRSLLPEVAGV